MRELFSSQGCDVTVQIRDPLLHRRFVSIVCEMNRDATALKPEKQLQRSGGCTRTGFQNPFGDSESGPQGLKAAFLAGFGGTAQAVPYPQPIL